MLFRKTKPNPVMTKIQAVHAAHQIDKVERAQHLEAKSDAARGKHETREVSR